MVCKNCGNQLRNNEKFCTICGCYNDLDASLESDATEEEIAPKTEPPVEKPKKVKKEVVEYNPDEDPLMGSYIGEDYKWIVKRPFNIYALLLSWIYFLYRKLYIIGIIGLLVTGIILRFAQIVIVPYIVLSMVFCGLFFNKIYLDIVEKRVDKLERNAKEGENLEALCKKKGGVNVFFPLLIFFFFLAAVILSFYSFNWNTKTSKFWSENGTNEANCRSLGRQVYNSLDVYKVEGELRELACVIEVVGVKRYNMYMLLNNKGKSLYLYFESDDQDYFLMKGNTDLIDELEKNKKEYGLSDSDEELLQNSKALKDKFSSIKDDASYEDKLIKDGKDTKEKLHYVFTKDDIFR